VSDTATVLVNPGSGGGLGARAALAAERAFAAAGVPVRRAVGADASEAARLAREAVDRGAPALIAVGGDGLVNLALNAVAGSTVPLGVVPAGTGNDLARALELPHRDPGAAAARAAEALAAGRFRTVDLGRVAAAGAAAGAGPDTGAGGWFGTVLACGLDSRVNDRANRMTWPHGKTRYDLALLAELAALRPVRFRLALEGHPGPSELELDATLIAVGNATSYGGGMRMCPEARLDDGLFDITVVGPIGRLDLVRTVPRLYRGTHLAHPAVSVLRAARVTIEADLTAYADGEPAGRLPLTATCVPGAARVLC